MDIRKTVPDNELRAVVLVNDGSSTAAPKHVMSEEKVALVDLKVNLGHQRALALGLVYATKHFPDSLIGLMDSDGEDSPRDLPRLIEAYEEQGCGFAVAERSQRSESMWFRSLYRMYKAFFHILTGLRINFGNFVVMNNEAANRLILMPETWNSLAGGILQARLPIARVPTARSRRYVGQSKMNFVSLVNHGLAAMSAFTERIFVRFTVALLSLLGALLAGAVVLILIRLLTSIAIPGWTSTSLGLVSISVIQILAVTGVLILIQASSRSTAKVVPLSVAPLYLPKDSGRNE